MKGFYLLILTVCTSAVAFSQQLPSQVQAKRGVFTERLFLNDRWIDRIATNVPSIYDSNNNVLPTTKAMADFLRLHSIQSSSVTADGDYIHNWNHKGLHIDSINRLRFDALETDSTNPDYLRTIHNTIQMYTGTGSDNTIKLNSALRNTDNTTDVIGSQISVSPYGAIMSTQNQNGNFSAGLGGNAVSLGATVYNGDFPETSTISVTPQDITFSLNGFGGSLYIYQLPYGDAETSVPVAYDPSTSRLVQLNNWPGNPNVMGTSYEPVYTGLTNVDSVSAIFATMMRVGNVAYISGRFMVIPDSAGVNTEVTISLPWDSQITKNVLSGTGFSAAPGYQIGAQIEGEPITGRALFRFTSTTTNPIEFSYVFQYFINAQP